MGFLFQFVAIGARDLVSAQKFADNHGFKKAYGSYDEIANDKEIGEALHKLIHLKPKQYFKLM